jgi:hypothetical protein
MWGAASSPRPGVFDVLYTESRMMVVQRTWLKSLSLAALLVMGLSPAIASFDGDCKKDDEGGAVVADCEKDCDGDCDGDCKKGEEEGELFADCEKDGDCDGECDGKCGEGEEEGAALLADCDGDCKGDGECDGKCGEGDEESTLRV